MSERGRLIVVEGIDGSGKTTLAKSLVAGLRSRGVDAVGERLLAGDRKFVQDVKFAYDAAGVEPGIKDGFFAAYFTHVLAANVATRLIPALKAGKTVVSDRYLVSHRVSQTTFGQSLSAWDPVLRILPAADLTLLLAVPVSVALDRMSRRSYIGAGDNRSFLERSARALGECVGPGWVRIDGTRPARDVLQAAMEAATKVGAR